MHEVDKRLDAFDGHGVVDTRTHAAYAAMALDVGQTSGGRLGDELLVEVFIARDERDVHDGAVLGIDRTREHVARVEAIVEKLGLGLVALLHLLETAQPQNPLEDESADVDAIGCRYPHAS